MIPQFLLVPLILRYWGEIEYSNYVGFLAAINIFTQIYGAVQNGYIITLIKDNKILKNEVFSMFIFNLIIISSSVIILLIVNLTFPNAFEKYNFFSFWAL